MCFNEFSKVIYELSCSDLCSGNKFILTSIPKKLKDESNFINWFLFLIEAT